MSHFGFGTSVPRLVGALPLLEVHWGLVSDQDFRDLLAALNFEATYEPTQRKPTITHALLAMPNIMS